MSPGLYPLDAITIAGCLQAPQGPVLLYQTVLEDFWHSPGAWILADGRGGVTLGIIRLPIPMEPEIEPDAPALPPPDADRTADAVDAGDAEDEDGLEPLPADLRPPPSLVRAEFLPAPFAQAWCRRQGLLPLLDHLRPDIRRAALALPLPTGTRRILLVDATERYDLTAEFKILLAEAAAPRQPSREV